VDRGVRQVGAVAVARRERQRRLLAREIVGEPRAVALHDRRARRLRTRQEQLARERELALVFRVLTAAMRVDALFLGVATGMGDSAYEHGSCEDVFRDHLIAPL